MRIAASLLAFVLAIGCASIAMAANRVALVVGNGSYKGAALSNPTVDADIVAASLRRIGFAVDVLKDADLETFDIALKDFENKAQGADVALFYFAGHGFTLNEGIRPVSMLMSTSADFTKKKSEITLKAAGIELDNDIAVSLVGKARSTLIFVDACRNDPRVSRSVGETGRGFSPFETVRGGSLFIGLSTRLGETAQDGEAGKGSPFARAFAAKIVMPGVRIDDQFRTIRDDVWTQTAGLQLPDVVQDDLPDGAITLVEGPKEQAAKPAGDPATAVLPAPVPVDARLAEAAQIWADLQASYDLDALKLFKNRYEGTYYADLAGLRLGEIETHRDTGSSTRIAALGDCDRLAASPFDASRPPGIAGVAYERIEAGAAVSACRAALDASPRDVRIAFQLARALQRAGGAEREAFELYRRAVDGGHVEAMNGLASLYASGSGAPKDEAEAVRLYRKGVDAGSSAAMNNLGNMYFLGSGVPKDDAEAVRWYRQAADRGLAQAMSNLGGMLANGAGVAKDSIAAVYWALKAAELGDPHGMSGLGVMYEDGEGIGQDAAQALIWYRQAAALGDEFAKSAVRRLSPQTTTSQ